MSNKAGIVILGAGVTGLTIALRILKDLKSIKQLVIVSDHFPDDEDSPPSYASTRAGGHWRAIATNDPKQLDLRIYETATYIEWNRVVNELANGLGYADTVQSVWSYDYHDEIPNELPFWWSSVVKDYEELPVDQLPEGVAYGVKYRTFVINCPEYIKHLMGEIKQQADRCSIRLELVRATVANLQDVSDKYKDSVLINCMGLGNLSVRDVQDTKCHPSRGQVLLADAPHVNRTSTRIGSDGLSYVIPRPGGACVLGGSHWLNCWLDVPDDTLTETIKRKTTLIVPELGPPSQIKVDAVSIGLRPCRVGGPRIEADRVNSALIHAYGVAGAGFQMSYGIADRVFEILETTLKHLE